MRARFVSSFLFVLSGFGALAAGEPRLARGPYLQALLSDSVKVLWLTDAPAAGAVRFWEAYGPASGSRNAFLDASRLLAPMADRFGVDIVFCGHDRGYQRSHPIREGTVVDAWQDPFFVRPRGTVYVVTAGGGGILYGELARSHHKKYMKLQRRAYHAVEFEASETELRLRARTPEGGILDEFSISKAEDPPRPGFLRGDVDYGGDVTLTDAIQSLGVLFLGAESACPGAYETVADADGTGVVDLADAVYLLNYLFLGGQAPGPPFERCEPLLDFDDAFCLRASCRL